ncbi:MAG: hypothetical protein ACD_76C00107G0002 [uncultured bacterium]|nr:MAG: hypothetical protein ACD_76C00107G0002 [uncultured bacterium]HBD05558.1 ATP synthase F1 subunit gamma [Candidatus Uhrbacteria bacterium]
MAVSTRLIKGRIKSVKNTRKITKAMELVAASKMRKATQSVVLSRPYSRLSWETVTSVSKFAGNATHPFLQKNSKSERVLVVLYISDRGLCGGYNSRMLKESISAVRGIDAKNLDVVIIGRRGMTFSRATGANPIAAFHGLTNNPKFLDLKPIAKLIMDEFLKETYGTVLVGYTDFISALTQTPKFVQLLPVVASEILKNTDQSEKDKTAPVTEYCFEPTAQEVLDKMLPKVIETMLWQALLESSASEHSARMIAMRSASDSASEMIDSLTFTFNQARQAGITQEIAEISSGKAALES